MSFLPNLKVDYFCRKCGWKKPFGTVGLLCKQCGNPLSCKTKLEDNKETPPHNGACDKVNVCNYATSKCSQPIPEEARETNDPFNPEKAPVAMSRRWVLCSGIKETLGMVFDKNVGSWVYPKTGVN